VASISNTWQPKAIQTFTKTWCVTVAGKMSDDTTSGTFNSISKQATKGSTLVRYAIVIEETGSNYSAYVPDLLVCIATAATLSEVESEIRDAIRFHLGGLKEDGFTVPPPASIA
jgi:predicted RNase H-like HicB family nuclease